MKRALILLTTYDPDYLRIVESIAIRLHFTGTPFTVLDVTPVQAGPKHGFSVTILRLGGFVLSKEAFVSRISELGGAFESVERHKAATKFDLSTADQLELDQAITSALLTFYRTDSPNFAKSRVRRMKRMLQLEGAEVALNVRRLLARTAFSHVYIPNGRFPGQRMAKCASLDRGLMVLHYEKGATAEHYYLRPYGPHARVESQLDVPNVLRGIHGSQVEALAQKWLHDRLPSADTTNDYTLVMPESGGTYIERGLPCIGFFTSSQDEFLFLGPEWQLHEWSSQEEAFDALLTFFESRGFATFLRVHPNLASKSHKTFLRERQAILRLGTRHPSLRVYWHDESVSSYELLDSATGIVVWDSTIGLEANARGIPVWNCAKSYYGMVADTREILGLGDVTPEALELWPANPQGAQRFIAYLISRDTPIASDAREWRPWGSGREPLLVQLARIPRSGGAPSVFDALLATSDLWRHRDARHTFKSISLRLRRRSILGRRGGSKSPEREAGKLEHL